MKESWGKAEYCFHIKHSIKCTQVYPLHYNKFQAFVNISIFLSSTYASQVSKIIAWDTEHIFQTESNADTCLLNIIPAHLNNTGL